jgi:hypothetical protein
MPTRRVGRYCAGKIPLSVQHRDSLAEVEGLGKLIVFMGTIDFIYEF